MLASQLTSLASSTGVSFTTFCINFHLCYYYGSYPLWMLQRKKNFFFFGLSLVAQGEGEFYKLKNKLKISQHRSSHLA